MHVDAFALEGNVGCFTESQAWGQRPIKDLKTTGVPYKRDPSGRLLHGRDGSNISDFP